MVGMIFFLDGLTCIEGGEIVLLVGWFDSTDALNLHGNQLSVIDAIIYNFPLVLEYLRRQLILFLFWFCL